MATWYSGMCCVLLRLCLQADNLAWLDACVDDKRSGHSMILILCGMVWHTYFKVLCTSVRVRYRCAHVAEQPWGDSPSLVCMRSTG